MEQKGEERGDKQRAEIKQLLMLLGSAIGVAIVFSAFMIYYYGPSGEYYVKNILLSPEMTGKLDFPDGVNSGRFVFDRAEYRYFDGELKTWKTKVLSHELYSKVYELLKNEAGLTEASAEVVNQFNLPNPATLTLYVKSDKITKIFQETVFVNNGDFYRISLRNNEAATSWAYFYHRKIYDQVLHAIQTEASK